MHTTLEHLDKHIQDKKSLKHPKNFLKEIKMLVIIFVVTFVWMLLFTNAQLFFGDLFWWNDAKIVERNNHNIQTDNTISPTMQTDMQKKEEKQQNLNKIIAQYTQNSDIIEKTTALTTKQELRSKLKSYDFDFNVLPPTNRLIIPKINLDVSLIDSKYKNKTDFANWDFQEELENWVVKYPTTPEPWFDGNTLLFGHTSQEWRQHNLYGTVFSHVPDLEQWDMMNVIRNWKLYEYKIIEKIVVRPSQVNKHYQSYQDKWEDYITIMWCYPLWRTDKRIMVTAKRVK